MLDRLDAYNVTWTTPSRDASGSMPLGNGDFGANIWVEESSGDLLLLLGKTDSFDENGILLKLGRVRVTFSPKLPAGVEFRQELRLRSGEIAITLGAISVRLWIERDPVIHIDVKSDSPTEIWVTLEMWRRHEYAVKTQTSDLFKNLVGKNSDPHPTIISPDHLLPDGNRLVWCHHNLSPANDGYEINLRLQGLGDWLAKGAHPLRGRTFGAAIGGANLVLDPQGPAGEPRLRSEVAAIRHQISIHALTAAVDSVDQWRQLLDRSIQRIESAEIAERRRAHESWWEQFWCTSWIYVTADSVADAAGAFNVTQAYLLQRFMNAAAGLGARPIKHNGSIFSVGTPENPDFRRWGPGYWFQNQRLIYWPMLASGDFDLMRPWLGMYRDCLELQRHRTRTYFGHGGAHFPETIYFWGAEVSAHYGWTPFEQRTHPEAECAYLTYYWSGGIELSLVLLAYFEHTGNQQFARECLFPITAEVMEFYDLHYPRDANGKIRFEPAQSLETWHSAVNPLPEIAGLRCLCQRTLTLAPGTSGEGRGESSSSIGPELLNRAKRILSELPNISTAERNGRRVILPAEQFDTKKNTENPELYCIFPYKLYGVGKPDLQLARDTFAARLHIEHTCWHQDVIQMAYLGLAEQAKESLSRRAAPENHSDSRFPAFWNQFHDEIPDIDHGGVLQIALQAMLMQCEGKEIRLLPAWPKGWNASFKLHAPHKTVVEGEVRDQRMVTLTVTPQSRRADLVPPDYGESE